MCGGSGGGGGGSMSKNGDAGQPGEVVREANKANMSPEDRVYNNLKSGKMKVSELKAAKKANSAERARLGTMEGTDAARAALSEKNAALERALIRYHAG